MMASDPPRRSHVLLVDDDIELLGMLASSIERAGYIVTRAASGAEALEVGGHDVDIALVDLHMPGKDGIAVVSELKRRTADDGFLPAILITGYDDADARVRGFEAGCDDFLTKPVNLGELKARMRTLLARREQHAQLAVANSRLRRAQKRKQQLASLVVHDLRNPLSALQGNVELLIEEVEEAGGLDLAREILGDCRDLCQKSLSMVAGLLDVEELEEGLLVARPTVTRIDEMCRYSARHHGAALKLRKLDLEFRVDPELSWNLDADLMGRLVENLLDNAVRYAPRRGRVVVAADKDGADLVIRVGNNGPPVPDAEQTRIFGRYYRLEARREGARANRGLGLYFCKLVAEAHRGGIRVFQDEELPASFEVRIP